MIRPRMLIFQFKFEVVPFGRLWLYMYFAPPPFLRVQIKISLFRETPGNMNVETKQQKIILAWMWETMHLGSAQSDAGMVQFSPKELKNIKWIDKFDSHLASQKTNVSLEVCPIFQIRAIHKSFESISMDDLKAQ